MHSLLQKYDGQPCAEMIPILREMVIKHEQLPSVPIGIQLLNQGGLVIVTPLLLPYLRAIVDKVSSLVNEECSRNLGHHMIEAARSAIECDMNLKAIFVHNIQKIGIDSTLPLITRVYNELSKKIFNARVNEYMSAAIEIDLERSGKAVHAEQGLRDELKTYSAMRTRSKSLSHITYNNI